jgi:anti-sigma factor RsiW
MVMGCEDKRELLSALVDGELDDGRRTVLAAHLLTCEECRRAAGELVAARGLAQRTPCDAEPPVGFHARMRANLDHIDGVRARAHQSPVARRLIGIAAAGAIAVLLAVIFATTSMIRADHALELAQVHQQVAQMPVIYGPPSPDGLSTVSCNPAAENWIETQRAVVHIAGDVVQLSVYQVGGSSVSIFRGPAQWRPYRTGRLVSKRIDGLDVRQVGAQSMTSWRQEGWRHVLVLEGTPEQAAEFARAYMVRSGRSPGL